MVRNGIKTVIEKILYSKHHSNIWATKFYQCGHLLWGIMAHELTKTVFIHCINLCMLMAAAFFCHWNRWSYRSYWESIAIVQLVKHSRVYVHHHLYYGVLQDSHMGMDTFTSYLQTVFCKEIHLVLQRHNSAQPNRIEVLIIDWFCFTQLLNLYKKC